MKRMNSFCYTSLWRFFFPVLFTLLAGPVGAKTLTVTNTADSGAGSLRQAILDAAAGDTIDFKKDVTGTISIASTLVIEKSLTIQGPGADVLTIDGGYGYSNPGTQILQIATDVTGKLSGLTFTKGRASYGGAISNRGTLTLNDCAVSGNYAGEGGAIVNYGTLTANDCVFDNNRAGDCGGIADYGKVLFNGCIFSHNAAPGGYAGALASINPVLINCAFYNNGAKIEGGAIVSDTLLAINCVFCGNGGFGDAISCYALTAVNCTISNNHSAYGCAIACGRLDADNCILWGNTTTYGEYFGPDFNPSLYAGKQSVVKYSDVEGGWPGEGNLNSDPLFVDADGPDDIRGNADDDLRLRPESPCLNAGNNAALLLDTFDLDADGDISEAIPYDRDGDPRVSGSVVDMGAYEVDLQALLVDALAALRSAVEDLVRNGALLPADGQPLYAKLDAALASLEAGNLQGAAGTLTAFSKQIQEFVKIGKLSPENGAALLIETSRASLLFNSGG